MIFGEYNNPYADFSTDSIYHHNFNADKNLHWGVVSTRTSLSILDVFYIFHTDTILTRRVLLSPRNAANSLNE